MAIKNEIIAKEIQTWGNIVEQLSEKKKAGTKLYRPKYVKHL